jgi:hypothetical protein
VGRCEVVPEKIMSGVDILSHPVNDESARMDEDFFVDGDLDFL